MNPPNKAEIAELEPFEGLGLESILVVSNQKEAAQALEDLQSASRVGFDTESKPTFFKGQKSEGPHVIQFSTTEKAYIFLSHVEETNFAVIELLKAAKITKVGFGLGGDMTQIFNRFGIRPESIVDLDRAFKKLGYRNAVGAKSAIAIFFNKKLLKAKSVTTSNWASKELSERQIIYAANDAYAAIQVFHAMESRTNSEGS